MTDIAHSTTKRERQRFRRLSIAWWALAAATVSVGVWIGDGGAALDLQFAVTPERAAQVLASVTAPDDMRRDLMIDLLLYVPLYTALAYTSVKIAQQRFYVVPQGLRMGAGFLFVALLVGVLDEVENLLTFTILSEEPFPTTAAQVSSGVVSAISGFSAAKYVGLGMIVLYSLPGLLWLLWRHPIMRRVLPRNLQLQDLPRPRVTAQSVNDGDG
ncbi:MAG TPA: hypothetical protein VJA46_00455 [Acidimicrobiia bacterium]|nr:hypothetical protein [Acidimicrobiia bacterium]